MNSRLLFNLEQIYYLTQNTNIDFSIGVNNELLGYPCYCGFIFH